MLFFLKQKPPSRYEMTVPATFLYELVEEMRERINRGLRVAETAVRSVDQKGQPETIRDLRRKYREALREGIIDSRQDVDLILLAKELDAILVTADQGVIHWAEKLGIKWLYPEMFKDFLMSSIRRASEMEKEHETVSEGG
jgi:RNA ligase partner protein